MIEMKLFLIVFGLLHSLALGVPSEENRRVADLEAQLKAVTSRLDDLVEQSNRQALESIKNSRETEKGDKSTRRFSRAINDDAAFTAELVNKVENLGLGTTVVFDHTIINIGNTYDIHTGVFTCSQSGIYLFSVFVESATGHEAMLALKMNGRTHLTAISEPSAEGEDDSGGNVVLLYVYAGSRVWVETITIDNQSLWPGITTFSGVLIHPDN